jgi:hypothetical protein
MRHAYGNANGDAHIHSDGDGDGNCHVHSDGDGNCHIHSDCDRDIYCNGDCDRYSYGHSHRIAPAYTDATASSDTAAPTVRRADCSLIWELASEPREFPDSIVVTTPFMWWQTTSQLQQRANCRIATQ